jgi:hypothetical protein
MNLQTILNVIGAASQLTRGLTSLVDNATATFSDTDADKVRTAAEALRAENDQLTQVVLAKLG